MQRKEKKKHGGAGREVVQYRNDNGGGVMLVGQRMEHFQIGISSIGEIIVRKL